MAFLFLKKKLSSWTASKDSEPLLRDNQGRSVNSKVDRPLLPREFDSESITRVSSNNSVDLESQSYNTFQGSVNTSETTTQARTRVNPRLVSDAILGLSDGLTVPFALSAGLSAFGDTKVVVLGSLAELVAGAISMGLGGYVGGRSEMESYETTKRETEELMSASPEVTMARVQEVFVPFDIPDTTVADISNGLHKSPERLIEFLLTFHHRETAPDDNQAWTSAITLAICYFVGGFIPLIPYFAVDQVLIALYYSIGVMAITLFTFGYIKTCVVRGWTGRDNVVSGFKGGIQMCLVGGLAAGAAIILVRVIDHHRG